MSKPYVSGAEKLRAKLQRLGAALPAMLSKETLGAFMLRRIRERYLKQVDENGNKWAELKPGSHKGPQILIQKGNLFKSLSVLGGPSGGRYGVATGLGFRIGPSSQLVPDRTGRMVNPNKYGRIHNQGLGITRRRFLGIGAADVKAVDGLLRREIRKYTQG